MAADAVSANAHVGATGAAHHPLSPVSTTASDTDSVVGLAASRSLVGSVYGRRMRLSILSILSVPVLFAFAPLELSMPFAVVALAAPLLTTCDCRREHNNRAQQQQQQQLTSQTVDEHRTQKSHSAGKEITTAADGDRAEECVDDTMQHHKHEEHSQHLHHHQHNHYQQQQQLQSAQSAYQASGSASNSLSQQYLIRSEERMVIRKQRVVTSKLVVRKVVTTEMVLMSVPVRRERLEVDTVLLDVPILLHDDEHDEQATATQGYVTALSSADRDIVLGAPFAGDRHNYAGVDDAGRATIELLLCEERPRIVMDLVPVSRVRVIKESYASSQMIDMELRSEKIDYVAPNNSNKAVIVQHF